MKWTTTQLIACGALGVLTLILTLPGVFVSVVLQIPGSSGLFAGVIGAAMAVLITFIFKKFGAATLVFSIYGILAIPTPIGPPGFLPKVLAFLITGVILDVVYLFLKNETKTAAIVIGSISLVMSSTIFVLLYLVFIPQLASVYTSIFYILLPFATVMGSIGGMLGYLVYNKIKKTTTIIRIQNR